MDTTLTYTATANQLVVFSLGDEDYALPIDQIKEVIRYTEPRSVVSSDRSVKGVINLRGAIVPVSDLGSRLGIAAAHDDADAKIIIIDTGIGSSGIIVDSVDEVLTIEQSHLDTTRVADPELVSGIAKLDDRLIVLLDAQSLTPPEQVQA